MLIHILLFVVVLLFLYLDVLQVFQMINSTVLTFLRLSLRLCGVTGDRIPQQMDSPLIWYLRYTLSRWQYYDNIDNAYMITIASQPNVHIAVTN